MNAIQFENVLKHFPKASYNAVNNVSLSIDEGEFITIVGTSGCGKTTLLKMVNRLYKPDSGRITLFGRDIAALDAALLRHGIGYVIQQIGLFPHMTVFDNIAVVPRILRWPRAKIKTRVEELLELVNLPPAEFARRHPAQLSGGQQQRVGLARALAASPRVMLLDEPFGAVDAINRANLQNELLRIHNLHKRTYLFVTHDITEAFKLGTRTLIMNKGDIQQFDTPQNIMQYPANDFVRDLIVSSGAYLAPPGDGI
ncbi:MAG: ABC transporter ATP-binding protein [Spirochaetaceae bacterium]|jgi:osmoprotectant transport system ATP-binding protein|nr:ABC transporter ATP-binding protein [Spirochaetaceae bacterium]